MSAGLAADVDASQALQQAIDAAPEGGVVRLPRGHHPARLLVRRSLTLVGEPGLCVLDAEGSGPVVLVDGPAAQVRLVGLVLQNGRAHAGGGVQLRRGQLALVDCTLRHNTAEGYGGGAVYAAGQRLTLERCQLVDNRGRQGGGLLLDGTVEAHLTSCLVARNGATRGGALRLKEGARATLEGCTLADNTLWGEGAEGPQVLLSGTLTRQPHLALRNCVLSGEGPMVCNGGTFPGTLLGSHVLVPGGQALPGVVALCEGEPHFRGAGPLPYALLPHSPAWGVGVAEGVEEEARDLGGRPRVRSGRLSLGAYGAAE